MLSFITINRLSRVPTPETGAKIAAAKAKVGELERQLEKGIFTSALAGPGKDGEPLAIAVQKQEIKAARDEVTAVEKSVPLQMVSVELAQPKPAFVLMRGDFQTPGDAVERDVPKFLPPFPAGQPRNRLGLARWLVRAMPGSGRLSRPALCVCSPVCSCLCGR